MDIQTQTHHLKFVIKGKPLRTDIGVKCAPRQTYGVSEQSPDQFKLKHTLTSQYGYIYKHQQNPNFNYFSQKKYISVNANDSQSFIQQYQKKKQLNPFSFHRKKGRLTQFFDKNGWMSDIRPIMGFQRSFQGRQLQLKERQKKINSLIPRRVYQNKVLKKKKVNRPYFETMSSETMGEKLKIRKQRNQFYNIRAPVKISRDSFSATVQNHQRELIQNKIIKNTNDWASSTKVYFYQPRSQKKLSRFSLIRELSMRKGNSCLNNGKDSLDPIDQFNKTIFTTKFVYKKQSNLDRDLSPNLINFK